MCAGALCFSPLPPLPFFPSFDLKGACGGGAGGRLGGRGERKTPSPERPTDRTQGARAPREACLQPRTAGRGEKGPWERPPPGGGQALALAAQQSLPPCGLLPEP